MIPNSSCPPTGAEEAISQAVVQRSDSQGEVPPLPKVLGYKKCMEHLASLAAMHSFRAYLLLKKTQSQDGKWNSASSHAQ